MEPTLGRARPTGMRFLAVLVVCVSALSACGSAETGSGSAQDAPSSRASSALDCFGDGDLSSRSLTKVDLDRDGRPEEVQLIDARGDCPSTIFANIDGREVSVAVPDDDVPITRTDAVSLGGASLIATRQDHPRGGFQVRFFALGDDGLTEVQQDGRPLVPFVATDVPEQDPLSVDCSDGKLVVTRGVTHEPVGVLPAWDIQQTTYTIDGAEVTDATTQEIKDNVLPQQLPREYPELVKHTLFASCR